MTRQALLAHQDQVLLTVRDAWQQIESPLFNNTLAGKSWRHYSRQLIGGVDRLITGLNRLGKTSEM